MIDLTQPGQCKALQNRIIDDIDKYSLTYDDGPRTHLGASLIGHECNFYLWATFRWLAYHKPNPRMQRLFRRGHLEELRFVEYLRGIGFEVWTHDEYGKQFLVTGVNGHYGGSCDGICKAPPHYDIDEPLLCEFKTKATGTGFNKLGDKGVKLAAPQHYAQASAYGRKMNIRYVLYIVVNKNDDDLHIEVTPLDWKLAEEMEKRAEYIITQHVQPSKISLNRTYKGCQGCDFFGVCHDNVEPDHNCRSCNNATVAVDGEWYCNSYKQIIPKDFIPKGCGQWQSLI